ncbi:MAG: hypothetical protein ISS70_11825 [Phycisphaerae bacterium]|nr:hypothetical protein [Phycisphaerae bacterium]
MKWFIRRPVRLIFLGYIAVYMFASVLEQTAIAAGFEAAPPIADAGLPRYAAQDPVSLDGTGSFDPDNSGQLSYSWRQISGPAVVITEASTATPTVSGFVQTDEVQECEFELVVGDGDLTSLSDTVKVIIVPDFGQNMMRHVNPPFDPNKPTLVYFGGGDCVTGAPGQPVATPILLSRTNLIHFHDGYMPDVKVGSSRTYYGCGDMIIVYLSSVAPDYRMAIQTAGMSTGGQPAVDVGIRLNLTYQDARYAVNHVTLLDAGTNCRSYQDYSESIAALIASSVDGEQCWLDNYVSQYADFYPNVLNVGFDTVDHTLALWWYESSWTNAESNKFNNGVVAGGYWSAIGPGKNLQLASTPETQTYKFKWHGDASSGYMNLHDEANHPGRLPEPVTLLAWRDSVDPKGVVLTCKRSENAVGYQLLFGSDPYRVMDYDIISDTPSPPVEVMTTFPFEETRWTVRARDQQGSTIYADPIPVDLEILPWPTIENLATGQTYGYIQAAINHAAPGDEIVIGPGTYQENIDFEGKNMTVTSINPNDPAVVVATIISGVGQRPVVTFSRGQGAGCVLDGLTITGGTVGISCGDASPTIRSCTIDSTGPIAIEFFYGYEPIIIDCTILGSTMEVYDPCLVALWKMDETDGSIAYDSIGVNDSGCQGGPLWQPARGMIDGALQLDGMDDYVKTPFIISPADGDFSIFAWIKGGDPGQVILSQQSGANWLVAGAVDGTLRTDLKNPAGTGRGALPEGPPLICSTVVTDGDWHRVGVVRDGSNRILYVDDVEVARDRAKALESSYAGLYIGAGSALEPGTFWSGLIDDVLIYNGAVKP